MNDLLEELCIEKRAHVEAQKRARPFDRLHEQALNAPPVRGFLNALRNAAAKEGVGFIAEIKKASPSAGVIREDLNPPALAKAYEKAGAACLSVLTDATHFQGRNEDLIEARKACALPVLRKDFMIDPWQVAEARMIGADCILVILAAVSEGVATTLCRAAHGYGMDVLIEVHTQDELKRALALPSPLIGVNSRNLKTLKIDLNAAAEILRAVPSDRFAVSESGIRTHKDALLMRSAGARGFLVGEALLKQKDAGEALASLRGNSL